MNIYDTSDDLKMYWLLTFIMIHAMQTVDGVDTYMSLDIMSLDSGIETESSIFIKNTT